MASRFFGWGYLTLVEKIDALKARDRNKDILPGSHAETIASWLPNIDQWKKSGSHYRETPGKKRILKAKIKGTGSRS